MPLRGSFRISCWTSASACLTPCPVSLQHTQACAERIKSDTTGQAHCTGQYFDFWHCVDHCVSVPWYLGWHVRARHPVLFPGPRSSTRHAHTQANRAHQNPVHLFPCSAGCPEDLRSIKVEKDGTRRPAYACDTTTAGIVARGVHGGCVSAWQTGACQYGPGCGGRLVSVPGASAARGPCPLYVGRGCRKREGGRGCSCVVELLAMG